MGGILGGSGSGGGSSTTVQKNELDPEIKARFLSNVDRATGVATNLGPMQFAPRTGDYYTGQNIIRNAAVNGPGIASTDYGAGITARAANFNPSNIDSYVNPYARFVAGNTLDDLSRANDMAINRVRGDAVASKAFGGSRQALAEAETNRNFFNTANKALNQIYSDAYNTGTNTALTANQQSIAAGGQLADIGQAQQEQRYNAGQAVGNLGISDQQFNQQQLDAIRNLPLEQQAIINQALGLNPAGGSGQTGQSTGQSSQSSSQGTGLFGLFR